MSNKNKYKIKKKSSTKLLLALVMAGGFFSCTADQELIVDETEALNSQIQRKDAVTEFIPDPDKVYTITTSSSTPIVLTTNGSGRITDTSTSDITVQQLWKFSPSAVAGSYYIDCLGGESLPRLSIRNGISVPLMQGDDSLALTSSWSITSTGSDDYFFTNQGDIEENRLTEFTSPYYSSIRGVRLTTDTSETNLEKFKITEVEFPFSDNRNPFASIDYLSINPFQTRTINVLDNDYDPDGDELTLVSFISNDDRILVEMIGNQLQVKYNTFDRNIIDITYIVSDENGATAQGILKVSRPRSNF